MAMPHDHDHHHDHTHSRDNNMRAAFVHVIADATVSVLVIMGLLLARSFGWLWMDPLAGIIGACVTRQLVLRPGAGHRPRYCST